MFNLFNTADGYDKEKKKIGRHLPKLFLLQLFLKMCELAEFTMPGPELSNSKILVIAAYGVISKYKLKLCKYGLIVL